MTNEFSTFYNTRQSILCSCPKCNAILRLSQLYIVSEAKEKKTWLDDYEEKVRKFQEKQGVVEQEASAIKDAAVKRGREQVPKMVISSLSDKVVSTKYDPYDIKPINHPIDYII